MARLVVALSHARVAQTLSHTPPNANVTRVLERLLNPSMLAFLRVGEWPCDNASDVCAGVFDGSTRVAVVQPDDFLLYCGSDHEDPMVIWNAETRHELLELCSAQAEKIQEQQPEETLPDVSMGGCSAVRAHTCSVTSRLRVPSSRRMDLQVSGARAHGERNLRAHV